MPNCLSCPNPIERSGHQGGGKPALYCSITCRERERKRRQRQKKAAKNA